jgi:hypothetical protein
LRDHVTRGWRDRRIVDAFAGIVASGHLDTVTTESQSQA